MAEGVRRSQRDYSLTLNWRWLTSRKDAMSYRQAQERYGIQGRSIVLAWLPALHYGHLIEVDDC